MVKVVLDPILMTDKLGKGVWNVALDPFGNVVPQKDRHGAYIRNVENNLRFPGQYFDAETGLHQNWHRDYDPKLGRDLEADPLLRFRISENLYSYGRSNPIARTDKVGLRSLTQGERNALSPYFGSNLNLDVIDLEGSLGNWAWSPVGNDINVPKDYFIGNDPCNELRLDNKRIYSVFAHEALHVWQRQHGDWVTLQGTFLQIGYFFEVVDPYDYDKSVTDPALVLNMFKSGNVERQGQMFQDYVFDDLSLIGVAKFSGMQTYVKTR